MYRAKKHLGQNFLINTYYQKKIISFCDLDPADHILEIGPGTGQLTSALASRVSYLIAIEKDKDLLANLHARLKDHTNVEVVHADIVQYPLEDLPDETKIISNLPYYVATPIIETVIAHKHKFVSFYMTVQYEYGQRIVAQPGNKSYSAFSCFVQYHADAKYLFKIPANAFNPVPKVKSCFLKLTFYKENPFNPSNEKFLFRIIFRAFQQRRKKVENALNMFGPKEIIRSVLQERGLDSGARAENLSLKDFICLADRLYQ